MSYANQLDKQGHGEAAAQFCEFTRLSKIAHEGVAKDIVKKRTSTLYKDGKPSASSMSELVSLACNYGDLDGMKNILKIHVDKRRLRYHKQEQYQTLYFRINTERLLRGIQKLDPKFVDRYQKRYKRQFEKENNMNAGEVAFIAACVRGSIDDAWKIGKNLVENSSDGDHVSHIFQELFVLSNDKSIAKSEETVSEIKGWAYPNLRRIDAEARANLIKELDHPMLAEIAGRTILILLDKNYFESKKVRELFDVYKKYFDQNQFGSIKTKLQDGLREQLEIFDIEGSEDFDEYNYRGKGAIGEKMDFITDFAIEYADTELIRDLIDIGYSYIGRSTIASYTTMAATRKSIDWLMANGNAFDREILWNRAYEWFEKLKDVGIASLLIGKELRGFEINDAMGLILQTAKSYAENGFEFDDLATSDRLSPEEVINKCVDVFEWISRGVDVYWDHWGPMVEKDYNLAFNLSRQLLKFNLGEEVNERVKKIISTEVRRLFSLGELATINYYLNSIAEHVKQDVLSEKEITRLLSDDAHRWIVDLLMPQTSSPGLGLN